MKNATKGSFAVVTGASSGIGLELAKQFAQHGFDLLIVADKGPSSGMRMLTFYINRAGKELPESRKKELEKAKRLLSERIRDQKKER